MNEYRVYTQKMARYLTANGFQILRTVQDVRDIKYLNWIFEATPELIEAANHYLAAYKH